MNRIYAVMLRQFYLLRATPTRFVQIFLWGGLEIVLWGFITKYLATAAGPGLGFSAQFLGAVLLWDFLTRVMQGVTTAFFEDVWSHNFLNMFGSPITRGEYITGLVLSSALTSLFSFAVMITLAGSLFGFWAFSYGLALLPFAMVLFLTGMALGILGISIVLRFGPSAEWFIWPIPAVIVPFVGVFYPISTLPHWMQVVSKFLPPSYVFESMRHIVLGEAFSYAPLAIAFVLALVCIALSYWFFSYIYRRAMKLGLIARYSAESVS